MMPTARADLQTPTFRPATPVPATKSEKDIPDRKQETVSPDDTQLNIPGFQVESGQYCPSQVVMKPIPPIFEDHSRAIKFQATQTQEGLIASPYLAAADITVRDILRRALGDWSAYGITDGHGKYIAMRVGYARKGPELPSVLSLAGVKVVAAEPVIVQAPTQTITSTAGIVCYPPERVDIRGLPGLLLRQGGESQGSSLPVNTLVWREGDMYWKLGAAMDSNSPYDLSELRMIAKDGLVQYDPLSKKWVEVH